MDRQPRRFLDCPIVLVENSGFDLSEFEAIAKSASGKRVEFLSFTCPPFDGSLGKAYGEMLCLEYCLDHSELLKATDRFLKISGRYYLVNAAVLLSFIAGRRNCDVICNFHKRLTCADSRASAGAFNFSESISAP